MEEHIMKKFARILSLTLVAVMLCATLASCGKVSGAYYAEVNLGVASGKVTYDFGAFGKVTMTVETSNIVTGSAAKTYEGKYEITEKDDDKMEITFTFEDENDDTKAYGGTQSFSIDKENDTIKIGLVTYKKAE